MKDIGTELNENILVEINGMFSSGRKPHAILIDGGDEDVRDSCARLIAKMTVCTESKNGFCGMCSSCRKADEGIHPDIITVKKPDDKKFFKKDDVKSVVENSYTTPNETDVKVFIISEMQFMTEESQNVLLKILEEPPSYTSFVLTSSSANAVIGTVLSRVTRIKLFEEFSDGEYSEKSTEVVRNIFKSLSSSYEFDLVAATSPLDGDKALTTEVLSLLCLVLRDCIVLKYGGRPVVSSLFDSSEELSSRFSVERLLNMYENVSELLRLTEGYPNYNLLSALLSVRLTESNPSR